MGRKKDGKATLQQARERGAEIDSKIITSEHVHKSLQVGTKRNYQRQYEFWIEFNKAYPEASTDDLTWMKRFVRAMAIGIDGAEGNVAPCKETVRKYWNAFTAEHRRRHAPIPRDVADSITQFIAGPLKQELNLTDAKRPRRFATHKVLHHLATQLFGDDWFEYSAPTTRFDDWCIQLGNTFSSARIGEYIESSCRSKTGRGLHFKDLVFGVFINEQGNAEFAIQLTRDAKGMSDTPDKRPQHALYEGGTPGPLCFNPMLFYLPRLLACNAFRDYRTLDELLAIVPPEGELLPLQWKEELLDRPFFVSDVTGRIETAGAFSRRFRALGIRSGFTTPPRNHDFRAEGLYWMNQFTSEATRMVYAGHTDASTVSRHYLPRNVADGQRAFLGNEGRQIIGDLFRNMTVPRNPTLWHRLPAEKQHALERSAEFREIEEQILSLEAKNDKESVRLRNSLHTKRRQMQEKALQEWQKQQPISYSGARGYHRAIFGRIKFMLPERAAIAQDIFQVDTMRSFTGLQVLRNLMSLYQKRSEVDYRPGLEPNKCSCSRRAECSAGNDWKHVYSCYRKQKTEEHGNAELCFRCNEWVYGSEAWENHCRGHLHHDLLNDFPMWCDPLTYGGVLATPGHCPFCVTDESLPASTRMHQFLHRATWLEHVQQHIRILHPDQPVKCPHPSASCGKVVATPLELQFHLQDAHGIDFIRERSLKRARESSEEAQLRPPKRSTGGVKKERDLAASSMQGDMVFVNFTAKTVCGARVVKSEPSSRESTPCSIFSRSSVARDTPSDCGTEISSLESEDQSKTSEECESKPRFKFETPETDFMDLS